MKDLNILDCSTLFSDLRCGYWPAQKPGINTTGRIIDCFDRVVNGIYHSFRIFLKTIPNPRAKKQKVFAKAQKDFCKPVERVCHVVYWVAYSG